MTFEENCTLLQRPSVQVWYQITVIQLKSISIRQKKTYAVQGDSRCSTVQQASRSFQAPCEYIYESLSCFWLRINLNWAGEMCVGKCRVQAGSRIAIIKLNLKPRIPNLYGRFTAENLVNGILCEFLLEKEMDFSLFVSILYDPD